MVEACIEPAQEPQLDRIEAKLDQLLAVLAKVEPLLKHLPRWLKA
jgi:hypothetical protein